jgi:hypothetical protein
VFTPFQAREATLFPAAPTALCPWRKCFRIKGSEQILFLQALKQAAGFAVFLFVGGIFPRPQKTRTIPICPVSMRVSLGLREGQVTK